MIGVGEGLYAIDCMMSDIIWFNERFKMLFGVPLASEVVNRSLIVSCFK